MHKGIAQLKKTRAFLLNIIEGLSTEALNKIPQGFNNNIIWNLGHIVASQQGICYTRSGEKPRLEEKYFLAYKPQTKPGGLVDSAETEAIKHLLISLIDDLETDYGNNLFSNYGNFTTSNGVEISNIDEAINFLLFHEGLHTGYIMALKRSLKDA